MVVLVILVAVTAQMTSGVSSIVNHGGSQIDDDRQARTLLDRMALDFDSMVKRTDVDYYLKGRPITNTMGSGGAASAQNDLMAFYSEVPGLLRARGRRGSSSNAPAHIRLGGRLPGQQQRRCGMERLSKGLDLERRRC